MGEENRAMRPSLWQRALRMVRGEGTAELVEQFTQEMTLVAEGLCEDQARLRRAVDGLNQREQSAQARSEQALEALDAQIRQQERALTELLGRVTALEQLSRRGRRLAGRRIPGAAAVIGAVAAVAVLLKLLS